MRIAMIVAGVVENVIEADSIERAAEFYPGLQLIESATASPGDGWDGAVFHPAAPVFAPPVLTRLEFLRRFSGAKRIAIRAAATSDSIIADALSLLDLAEEVRLDDPDTQAFTGYLVSRGLLTADERSAVLAI